MASITIHVKGHEKPTAQVLQSTDGLFVSFSVGDATIYIPGDDDIAIENTRTWAAQLLNAANTVSDRLAIIKSIPVPEVVNG